MASRPEYLKFVEIEAPSRKTRVIKVRSARSDVLLGTIAWYGSWRQYVLYPEASTIFNPDCLETINAKIRALMAERRRG